MEPFPRQTSGDRLWSKVVRPIRHWVKSRSASAFYVTWAKKRWTWPLSARARPDWRRPSMRLRRAEHRRVLDRVGPGGQAGSSSRIENYMGFPGRTVRLRPGEPGLFAGPEFGATFTAPVTARELTPAPMASSNCGCVPTRSSRRGPCWSPRASATADWTFPSADGWKGPACITPAPRSSAALHEPAGGGCGWRKFGRPGGHVSGTERLPG